MPETKRKPPEGCSFYCESKTGLVRLVAYGTPPKTGDAACLRFSGHTENELVRRILAGEYNDILRPKKDTVEKGA